MGANGSERKAVKLAQDFHARVIEDGASLNRRLQNHAVHLVVRAELQPIASRDKADDRAVVLAVQRLLVSLPT
jgi:hypothetical protein